MAPMQVKATIAFIEPVGTYFHMRLNHPGLGSDVRPGNFVAIAVGDIGSGMLLRRAFSIHRADDHGIDVIFAPHGQGTQWLAQRVAGDVLDVIAPLGTPFTLPRAPIACVLVAGGYGAAPMGMLADALRERGCRVDVVLGAASQDRLFGVLDAMQYANSVTVTTDDGTSGVRGRVTDVLPQIIQQSGAKAVYACGPMGMLQAVAEVSAKSGAYSQCAVEESMACGIGVCMTCVLPVIGDDGVTRMVRSCVEGPVFRGDRVRWNDVDTVPSDALGAPVPGGH